MTQIYLAYSCFYFQKRIDFLQLMLDAHTEARNDDTEHDQEFHDVHGGTERKGIYKQVAFYYKMTQLRSDMSTLWKLSQ